MMSFVLDESVLLVDAMFVFGKWCFFYWRMLASLVVKSAKLLRGGCMERMYKKFSLEAFSSLCWYSN